MSNSRPRQRDARALIMRSSETTYDVESIGEVPDRPEKDPAIAAVPEAWPALREVREADRADRPTISSV